MNITDIKIRALYPDSTLRGLVSVTLDNQIAIHDIKIIEGPNRLFVAMPSRKDDKGIFRDICHPISADARRELEEAILNEFNSYSQGKESVQAFHSDTSIVV